MKLWTLAVAATCLVMLMPAAPAANATFRQPYDGPAVLAYDGPSDCADPVRSMGIACVDVPNGAKTLDLRVLDTSGLPVGGVYHLGDANGEFAGLGIFCGSATVPLTGDVATAVIRLEAVNGPLACAELGQTGALPTQGIIAMRLR